MLKRILLGLALGGLLWGCAGLPYQERHTPQDNGQAPELLDYYAPQVIRPGYTWRIYLHARDNDGDMHYIFASMWQAGVGAYPVDSTLIKTRDKREFAGYLFLNTPADQDLVWDNFYLEVLVRDRRENRSKTITVPLTFDYVPAEELPDKWATAARYRLGVISIEIQSSEKYNSQGDGANHVIAP